MPARAALRWLEARGWLVLAGAATGTEDINARALAVAAADGSVAVLACSGENNQVDQLLADFAELGAPSGYILDVNVEDDATLRARLSEAGLVVAGAAADALQVQNVMAGAVAEGIRLAWQRGALVLLAGPAAMTAGAWVAGADDIPVAGTGWLPGTLILPGEADAGNNPLARALDATEPAALALGIGHDSALALGPDGQLELWGEAEVSITLGAAWHSD